MDNLQNFFNHLYQKEGDRFQMNEQAVVNELQTNEADKTTFSVKIVSVLGGLLATLAFLAFFAFFAGLEAAVVAVVRHTTYMPL